jgi:hypothetical protein
VPINGIPPEVLTLIPDFWGTSDGDRDLIALTHVCWAWRQAFISRSSLWTYFDCRYLDADNGNSRRSSDLKWGSSPIDCCGQLAFWPRRLPSRRHHSGAITDASLTNHWQSPPPQVVQSSFLDPHRPGLVPKLNRI